MDEKTKDEIIASVQIQLPSAAESRLRNILSIIELEIETYNDCGNEIDWKKLQGVIAEVLYQSMKIELDKSVESVKRGDTTISYVANSNQIKGLVIGYKDLIKRVIGCGGVVFW